MFWSGFERDNYSIFSVIFCLAFIIITRMLIVVAKLTGNPDSHFNETKSGKQTSHLAVNYAFQSNRHFEQPKSAYTFQLK